MAAAAAVASASAATRGLSSPATTRAAAARSPPESPTAIRARERAAARQRLSRERQAEARAATLAAAREMLPEEGTSAFDYKANGDRRASSGAGRTAKCAHVKQLERALTAGQTTAQDAEGLRAALQRPEVRALALGAGIVAPHEAEEALAMAAQMRKAVERSTHGGAGRPSTAQRQLLGNVAMLVADSPDSARGEEEARTARRRRGALLGLAPARADVLLRQGEDARGNAKAQFKAVYVPVLARLARKSSIEPMTRDLICEFVTEHPLIVASPISTDTVWIMGDDGEKVRVPKLLCQIPLAHLYAEFRDKHVFDAEARPDGVHVGERSFLYLLPPQLRRMTDRHKEMCGCRYCVEMHSCHASLCAWQTREAELPPSRQGAPAPPCIYPKPADVVAACLCAPHPELGQPHWKCVLGRCDKCGVDKKLVAPLAADGAREISFQHYKYVEATTQYGTSRKLLKLCEETAAIGDFMDQVYKPALKYYIYHRSHFKLFQELRADRKRFPRGHISDLRDYSERLTIALNNEIQTLHWQTTSVSIEVSLVLAWLRADGEGALSDIDETREKVYYHLSDFSKQDAAVTARNMTRLITDAMASGELAKGGTVWQKTDGCGKQYRSSKALYLLSLLSSTHGVVIDRMIEVSGHGKDAADGLGGLIKRFLRARFQRTRTPGVDEPATAWAAASLVNGTTTSVAAECARQCALGFTQPLMGGMRSKAHRARAIDERVIDLYTMEDVKHQETDFKTLKLGAGHDGLMGNFNLRTDPELGPRQGLGRAMVRRCACGCDACKVQLELRWLPGLPVEQQPRYASSRDCKYATIFEGLNDWRLVELEPKTAADAAEVNEDFQVIWQARGEALATRIADGVVGAIAAGDDPNYDYYLVCFSSGSYALPAARTITEFNPPIELAAGSIVANALFYNHVPGARNWWTPAPTLKVVVPSDLVLHVDIEVETFSKKRGDGLPALPTACKVSEAKRAGAVRVPDKVHAEIVEAGRERDLANAGEVDYASDGGGDDESEPDE